MALAERRDDEAKPGAIALPPDAATADDILAAGEGTSGAMADTGAFNERLQAAGHFVYANGLASATTATVVDGRGAAPVFTDGPYLETREHVGGFWMLECADQDEAAAWGRKAVVACRAPVEVRALWRDASEPSEG